MRKDLLKKIKKELIIKNELRRAHLMIALLAIGIVLLVLVNSAGYTAFSNALTVSLVVLSLIIALISLFVVVNLSKK